MYGAIMLLKIHAGQETYQSAKSACAQRFMGLYFKHFRRQATSLPQAVPPLAEEAGHAVVSLPAILALIISFHVQAFLSLYALGL
jgi:hypothetical protein